jgi:hypothetical protein
MLSSPRRAEFDSVFSGVAGTERALEIAELVTWVLRLGASENDDTDGGEGRRLISGLCEISGVVAPEMPPPISDLIAPIVTWRLRLRERSKR